MASNNRNTRGRKSQGQSQNRKRDSEGKFAGGSSRSAGRSSTMSSGRRSSRD